MTENSTHAVGSVVTFRPGPKAKGDVTGTVKEISGRGLHRFMTVECTDGKTRKVRPGSARAA